MPKPFITRLLQEHIRLWRVLRVLERQFDLALSCETPDLRLLLNALSFLRGEPARLHHYHEERMFDRLQAVDPGRTCELNFQREQHREIYQLEDSLKELVGQAATLGHAAFPRLLYFGREYLRVQKSHSKFEEHVILPRAVIVLKRADWMALERHPRVGFDDEQAQERVLTMYRELIPLQHAA